MLLSLATARTGCALGDELWFSALQNVILSHNVQIHADRMVTRYEEFCGHAPNIDKLFRFRLGQFVTVTAPEHKRTKQDHAMRGPVCIALHSADNEGVWVWFPGTRKALIRGHLYVEPVIYDGIQNQSLMIEDVAEEDAVSSKGAITYPHPSIVKFIERRVDMECAEADKMDLTIADDTPVSLKPEEATVLPGEPFSATLQIALPVDIALEDEPVGDALIGVRVRRLFRNKGKKGKSAYYSGTVTKYKAPYYWVD